MPVDDIAQKQLAADPAAYAAPSPAPRDDSAPPCLSLPLGTWHPLVDTELQREASSALEQGKVLTLPRLAFTLTREEEFFLREDCVATGAPYVRLSPATQRIDGLRKTEKGALVLAALLKRYQEATVDLVARLFPAYMAKLEAGFTFFEPLHAGKGKIDYPLSIEADSSHPTGGRRLLTIATNINPHGAQRVCRIGEPFTSLLTRFLPKLNRPVPLAAQMLRLLRVTQGLRTPYDSYMLQLKQCMRRDPLYQADGPQSSVVFAPGSSWMWFADEVPCGVTSGQFALRQTFLVPMASLDDPLSSPLGALEKLMYRRLA